MVDAVKPDLTAEEIIILQRAIAAYQESRTLTSAEASAVARIAWKLGTLMGDRMKGAGG